MKKPLLVKILIALGIGLVISLVSLLHEETTRTLISTNGICPTVDTCPDENYSVTKLRGFPLTIIRTYDVGTNDERTRVDIPYTIIDLLLYSVLAFIVVSIVYYVATRGWRAPMTPERLKRLTLLRIFLISLGVGFILNALSFLYSHTEQMYVPTPCNTVMCPDTVKESTVTSRGFPQWFFLDSNPGTEDASTEFVAFLAVYNWAIYSTFVFALLITRHSIVQYRRRIAKLAPKEKAYSKAAMRKLIIVALVIGLIVSTLSYANFSYGHYTETLDANADESMPYEHDVRYIVREYGRPFKVITHESNTALALNVAAVLGNLALYSTLAFLTLLLIKWISAKLQPAKR